MGVDFRAVSYKVFPNNIILLENFSMVKKDAVVSLSYTLTNADGEELDKSSPDKPFAYLHGNKQIVPGLENALEGLAVGDKKEVTVPPAEGYGEFVAGLKMDIDRSSFPKDIEIQPGMQFSADPQQKKCNTDTCMARVVTSIKACCSLQFPPSLNLWVSLV
jgi:FKBP-type peptidyl-prolyl cis-trans isomerase 2